MSFGNIMSLILGVGMIAFNYDNDSLFGRLLALIGLGLVIKGLIALFKKSDALLTRWLPKGDSGKALISHKFIYYLATVTFPLGLVAILIEMLRFERMLRPGDFWTTFFAIGALISLILIILAAYVSRGVYDDSKRRFSIFWGFFIGLPLIIIALASFTNRVLRDVETIETQQFQIIEKRHTGEYSKKKKKEKKEKFQIIFKTSEDSQKRLEVKEDFYNELTEGGVINVEMTNGWLGFELIEEVRAEDGSAGMW